jgi:AcrR family transcriptional regulator
VHEPEVDELLRSSGVNRTSGSQRLMEQILDAATQLFSEKGFLGTTTQELADAVGLVKGTLYYHIGSKDELLYRIHQQVTEEGTRRWQAILDEAQDLPATQLLERLIVEHCQVIHEYRDWVAVFSEEMKYLPPDYAEKVRANRVEYQGMLESVIERGTRSGELVDRDPRVTALMILGMLNAMYRWYSPRGRFTPAKIGEVIASVVLDGTSA